MQVKFARVRRPGAVPSARPATLLLRSVATTGHLLPRRDRHVVAHITTRHPRDPFVAVPERARARRLARRELFTAFPVRAVLLGTACVLSGVLPSAFAALVGVLVAQAPAAVGHGFASPAGHRLGATLAGVAAVLMLQEAVAAGESVLSNDLYRRFDAHLLGRLIELATRWPDLDLVDDPANAAKLDRARRIAQYGPGELVSGLQSQWRVRVAGVASAVLLATVLPVPLVLFVELPLVAGWVVVGFVLQASYYRADPFWSDPLRRARYFQQVGLMPEWAKELRVFGLIDWLTERYSDEWRQVMATLQRARRADRYTLVAWTAGLLLANAAAMLVVVHAAWTSALSLAELVVAVQALLGLASLSAQDGDVWIENGAAPMPEMVEFQRLIDSRPADRPNPAAAPATPQPPLPSRAISFQDVRFGYAGRNTPVFDELELELTAGRSCAIVGLNGAGKTTLVKLLTGLCRPQRGRVLVDGTDLAELDLQVWRRAVAVIFQDFVHYELSLRDNVAFGAIETAADTGPTAEVDRRVRDALRSAGAEQILAGLPAGLDTVLSRRFPGGVDLSGGQWQRLALARALFATGAGARVLVLDEPTAHLDVRAEVDLFDRFLELTAGLTTVLISHRFSTVRRADRIVVLDGGRVIEDGSHDDLVARGGRYARMFELQAGRYADLADGEPSDG